MDIIVHSLNERKKKSLHDKLTGFWELVGETAAFLDETNRLAGCSNLFVS
jgi:hypothetical protein